MIDKLALFGGQKTIQKPFTRYNPIGIEEVEAAPYPVEILEEKVRVFRKSKLKARLETGNPQNNPQKKRKT